MNGIEGGKWLWMEDIQEVSKNTGGLVNGNGGVNGWREATKQVGYSTLLHLPTTSSRKVVVILIFLSYRTKARRETTTTVTEPSQLKGNITLKIYTHSSSNWGYTETHGDTSKLL